MHLKRQAVEAEAAGCRCTATKAMVILDGTLSACFQFFARKGKYLELGAF
jgi:hypothetical protein